MSISLKQRHHQGESWSDLLCLKIQKASWGRLICSLGQKTKQKKWIKTAWAWLRLTSFWSRVQFILSASGSAGRTGCRSRCSEHFLRGVGDVEEAVGVSVAGINFPHAGGHAGHALLRHQEEQSLGGVEVDLIPRRKTKWGWGVTPAAWRRQWREAGDEKLWEVYLRRHRNWPKVSSKGTRNFVLSSRGRVFSRV